jgi:hypothetical protein
MSAFFKFGIVLAFGLAIGLYVDASLDSRDVAACAWRDVTNMDFANARPDMAVDAIDPAAAARVDEELDYRISERIESVEGWRSFLARHGTGAYADKAIAEIEKLLSAKTANADPDYAERRSPEANTASGAPPPSGMEVSTDMGNDISNLEEPGVEPLRGDTMGGGEGGRSQPQPAGLTGSRDDAAPAQAAAPILNVAKAETEAPLSPGPDAATPAAAPADASEKVGSGAGRRLRAITPASIKRRIDSPHNPRPRPRRHAMRCSWRSGCFRRAATAPPILLALFGQKPRNSTAFALMSGSARPDRLHGR